MACKWILYLVLFLALGGCSSIGPHQLNLDRSQYNEVVTKTQQEELLANIVRTRYLESVNFMKITSITSSYSLSPSIAPSYSINWPNVSRNATLSPSLSYSDSPSFSYAPLMSSDFINKLLSPILLSNITILLNGGSYDPALLFRLVIRSINDIDNAFTASYPRINSVPHYHQFYRFLAVFRELHRKGGCKVIVTELNGNKTFAIHFSKGFARSSLARKMRKILKLPNNSQDILLSDATPLETATTGSTGSVTLQPMNANSAPLTVSTNNPLLSSGNNIAYVDTRSVLGVINFLSHSVQVPDEHINKRLAHLEFYPDGRVFDWSPLMNGIFKVYSSSLPPSNAFIKIYYQNYWFYIRNDDFDSKLTLDFLRQLFILSAGQELTTSTNSAPILTHAV